MISEDFLSRLVVSMMNLQFPRPLSENRPRHPRAKLFVTDALLFTQSFLSTGRGNDALKDFSSH
jgi:hypothetical protein